MTLSVIHTPTFKWHVCSQQYGLVDCQNPSVLADANFLYCWCSGTPIRFGHTKYDFSQAHKMPKQLISYVIWAILLHLNKREREITCWTCRFVIVLQYNMCVCTSACACVCDHWCYWINNEDVSQDSAMLHVEVHTDGYITCIQARIYTHVDKYRRHITYIFSEVWTGWHCTGVFTMVT